MLETGIYRCSGLKCIRHGSTYSMAFFSIFLTASGGAKASSEMTTNITTGRYFNLKKWYGSTIPIKMSVIGL